MELVKEKIKYGTKEYWKNHLDSVLKTLEEDKDKLVDIMMDKCMSMDIIIPIRIGEAPRYEVNFSKSTFKLKETNK